MGWGRGPGQRGRFVTLNFCEREGATAASRSWSRSELWNRAVVPSCGAELWCRAVVPSCGSAGTGSSHSSGTVTAYDLQQRGDLI